MDRLYKTSQLANPYLPNDRLLTTGGMDDEKHTSSCFTSLRWKPLTSHLRDIKLIKIQLSRDQDRVCTSSIAFFGMLLYLFSKHSQVSSPPVWQVIWIFRIIDKRFTHCLEMQAEPVSRLLFSLYPTAAWLFIHITLTLAAMESPVISPANLQI